MGQVRLGQAKEDEIKPSATTKYQTFFDSRQSSINPSIHRQSLYGGGGGGGGGGERGHIYIGASGHSTSYMVAVPCSWEQG